MSGRQQRSSATGFTGSADRAAVGAVLACAPYVRGGAPVPASLAVAAHPALAPAFGLSPSNTVRVDQLTPMAFEQLVDWAARQ